MIHYI